MAILKDWLKGTDYKVLLGTDECEVSDVIFDSRKAAAGTVFLCMKGSRIDSHDFIGDVIEKGCTTFVVEKEAAELKLPRIGGLNIIYTENARETLAFLSAARFDHPSEKMKMIGLTGTKGKTTSSYMFKAVLEKCGFKTGVIGTNGCVIGDTHIPTKNTTPDSYELNGYFARMAEEGCEYVVMECSSQGFKMDRTAGITFDYGVFLNISPDHIGPLEHADFDEYLYYKSRLFTQCRTAVLNIDDERTKDIVKLSGCREKKYFFSVKSTDADIYAYDFSFHADSEFTGTEFWTGGLLADVFRLSIPGEYNVSNVMSVITVAYDLGLPMDKVREALLDIHVDGRSEVVYKSDKFTVLVDYAHNEVSMVTLMDTLKKYEPKRLVAVFGCGGNRSKDRRIGMGTTAASACDFSIFTADNSRFEKTEDIIADIEGAFLEAGGKPEAYVKIPDRREAIKYAMANAEDGDIIAVIGKGHEDYQEENGVRTHFLDREEILKCKDELGL
ncbi:MAG: UDP-N-acetylmuramoyl-L-alanyl-D-glutamate--2,6-diaminopimelate ligase [Eubacteriales bacterium]|nr:UDP-N-acetylmuramoyl-L-alanyl-D-glutamate--2,6-diaminopimelate ligase [Eubacteriales bacterium]